MKFTKRIILIMLFFISALTFTSFVKHTEVNAEGEAFEIVETGVKYADLTAARAAATSGQTIKLLCDFEYTGSGYSMNKDLIIDFGDYTLTSTAAYFLTFNNGDNYSLTLKASGNGGFQSSRSLIYLNETLGATNTITIESGTYNRMNIFYSSVGNLNMDGFSSAPALQDRIIINGGKFYLSDPTARANLKDFVATDCISAVDERNVSPKFILEVKPKTYITDENTQTSLNLSYDKGYSYYREVTSLSSSDAGKKYLIAYVNKSEDVIYIMKNYENVSYHVMQADKHNNVNKTNDGTWYINSNSEFYGNPDEDFFITLGYTGNGYSLSVKAGATNKLLYFNNANGNQISPQDDSYQSNANYIYSFGFNSVNHYFYATGVSKCLAYTPSGTYANYFRMAGSSETYPSGIGDNKNVYARLFEKVDVNPEVDEAAIRFGKCITKDMYDYVTKMGTDVSFGVIAKRTSALGGAELTVANASMTREITPVRVSAPGAAVEDLEGDYYQFALVINDIHEANFETSITARVYVCVDGEYYYMNASEYSVKTLAAAYYNAVDTSAYTEHLDVLKYLKDYVG